jgi:hypothetical protein
MPYTITVGKHQKKRNKMANFRLITLCTTDEYKAKKLLSAISAAQVGGSSCVAATKLTKRTVGKTTHYLAQLLGSPSAIQPAQMLATFSEVQCMVLSEVPDSMFKTTIVLTDAAPASIVLTDDSDDNS